MDENTKFTTLAAWKKLVIFFLAAIFLLHYLGAMINGVIGTFLFFLAPGRVYVWEFSLKLMIYSGLWQDYPKVLLSVI